jgi:hypothetical protein
VTREKEAIGFPPTVGIAASQAQLAAERKAEAEMKARVAQAVKEAQAKARAEGVIDPVGLRYRAAVARHDAKRSPAA